jgi:hypothetical protein
MAGDIRVPEHDVLRHARDPGRRIDCAYQVRRGDDAFHWLGVYSWLIACQKKDLEAAKAASASSSSKARREAAIDVEMLTSQADRYEERLRYWQSVVTMDGDPNQIPGPESSPAGAHS